MPPFFYLLSVSFTPNGNLDTVEEIKTVVGENKYSWLVWAWGGADTKHLMILLAHLNGQTPHCRFLHLSNYVGNAKGDAR